MKCLFDMSDVDTSRTFYSINLYKYRLLDAMSDEEASKICLLLNDSNVDVLRKRFSRFNYIIYKKPSSFLIHLPIIGRIYNKNSFAKFVNKSGCDCFFSASNIDYKITSKFSIYKVVVIHDIKAIWEGKGFWSKIIQKHRVLNYYKRLVNNSSMTIAISNFTKQNILNNIIGVEKDKLCVVYNSVVVSPTSEVVSNLPSCGYLLYVNSLDEYKNLGTLIKAYNLLKERTSQELVIVGNPNDYWYSKLLPFIEENKFADRVHLLCNISDEKLRYLYENATLFVSPSLNEGFGYTPLEAAICGCPVICSKCEALPDTTKGMLSYYDNPLDEFELADKIYFILNNRPSEKELLNISLCLRKNYSAQKQKTEILHVLNML